MNLLMRLAEQPLTEAVGWTLLHFLWQGAVIALVMAVALRLLARGSARVRYLFALCGLVVLTTAPVCTTYCCYHDDRSLDAPPNEQMVVTTSTPGVSAETVVGAVLAVETSPSARAAPRPESDLAALPAARQSEKGFETLATRLRPYLPTAVACWIVGVFVLSTRLLWSWRRVRRWCVTGISAVDAVLSERFDVVVQRMRVSRPVRLLRSTLVEVPVVVGWVRPIVLLPTSVLTGLTPRQLEMILAHELAHVRRYDYLVNLAQTLIETLLFYHPAVWWLSGRVRQEREHC